MDMINQKKIYVLLSFILFLTLCTPAHAVSVSQTQTTANAFSKASLPSVPPVLSEQGIVLEVNQNQITIETKSEYYPIVTLNTSDKTVIMDSQTGLPVSLQSIKQNDSIMAYFSSAMTRSIPPQASAFAILTNLPVNGPVPAHLHTVGSVENKDNGDIRILTSDGSLYITVPKGTPVSMLGSDTPAALSDIKPGTDFFAWYEIVLMSYPGQTGASKIVLLPSNVLPAQTQHTGLSVNGKKLNEDIFMDNGNVMVPVRAVGEALGFTVTWNPKDRSVSLDNGEVKTTITLGADSYYKASSKAIGLTAPFSLGSAPVAYNGRVYVPAAMFNLLYSNDNAVTLSNGTVDISSK